MVRIEEIADKKHNYNLNLPRYIDSTEPEDLQDIDGHLRGAFHSGTLTATRTGTSKAWPITGKSCPPCMRYCSSHSRRPGYSHLRLPLAEVKLTILNHAEFIAFNDSVSKIFTEWRHRNTSHLRAFAKDGHPKGINRAYF
jgi:type I restriction enzyme M protein